MCQAMEKIKSLLSWNLYFNGRSQTINQYEIPQCGKCYEGKQSRAKSRIACCFPPGVQRMCPSRDLNEIQEQTMRYLGEEHFKQRKE